MGRPVARPLSLRTTGFVWLALSVASVVPSVLPWASLALVAGIVATWGRGRSWHLWVAAGACWLVTFACDRFDPAGAWVTGLFVGGFPALAMTLFLWWRAERERPRTAPPDRRLRSA